MSQIDSRSVIHEVDADDVSDTQEADSQALNDRDDVVLDKYRVQLVYTMKGMSKNDSPVMKIQKYIEYSIELYQSSLFSIWSPVVRISSVDEDDSKQIT